MANRVQKTGLTGLLFCREEKKGQPLLQKQDTSTGGKHCPICHFRVRGPNHKQGSHHLSKVKLIDM